MYAYYQKINAIDRLRIRFWLSQLALLTALLGILSEGISNSPILLGLTIFMGLSMLFPPIAGVVPRNWMRPLSILLITGVAIDLAINWQQLLNPILRAGYLILWTRTVFYRTSREAMQLLLLALFLIMLTGVISVSISYILQLILFTPLAMILLMLNTTKDPELRDCLEHKDWKQFDAAAFFKRVRASLSPGLVGMVGVCIVFMTVSISAIFVILPRFNFGKLLPSVAPPGIARSGFSENFQLGSVNSIIQDTQIAFRVNVPDPALMPDTPYWRMLVLDVYQNGSFSKTNKFAHKLTPPVLLTSSHHLSNRMIPDPRRFNGQDWTVYLEGSVSRYLPIPGSFRSIQFQSLQSVRIDPVLGTLNLNRPSSQLTTFRMQHVIADQPFRSSAMDNLLDGMRWTPISPDSQTQIRDLAYPGSTLSAMLTAEDDLFLKNVVKTIHKEPIISTQSSPFASYEQQVISYLHNHHEYSLHSEVKRGGNRSSDPVIAWLQSDSPGHCEYFAAAAVLLFRCNDIPARMITGFAGGEWNRAKDTYIVRNLNAHAWCEIFSPTTGWVRIDPTPESRLLMDTSEFETLSSRGWANWFSWTESIKLNYYKTIIGFDDESQYEMIANLGIRLHKVKWNPRRLGEAFSRWFSNETPLSSSTQGNRLSAPWVKTTLLVLSLTCLCGVVPFLRFRRLRNRSSDRRPMRQSQEYKYRMRAKHLLAKSSHTHIRPWDHEIHQQMLKIRFGPVDSWGETRVVFRRFRKALKRAKRCK